VKFQISKIIKAAINIRFLLITLTLIFSLLGCDSIVFENKIDTILEPVDHVKYFNISPAFISDTTWTKTPKRDKTIRLFIGKFDDYESVALLKFEYLDTLLDIVGIDSLRLILNISNTIGAKSSSPKILSLYWNRMEWNEDDLHDSSLFKIEDFMPDPLDLLASDTVVWENSDTTAEKILFDIPLDSLQNWISSPDKHGFIIVSDSLSNFIVSSSHEASAML